MPSPAAQCALRLALALPALFASRASLVIAFGVTAVGGTVSAQESAPGNRSGRAHDPSLPEFSDVHAVLCGKKYPLRHTPGPHRLVDAAAWTRPRLSSGQSPEFSLVFSAGSDPIPSYPSDSEGPLKGTTPIVMRERAGVG